MTTETITHVQSSRDRLDETLRTAMSGGHGNIGRIQIGGDTVGEGIIIADMQPMRRCGQCTFCCTAAGVAEIKKPAMVPCRHLVRGGCGIHHRPELGFPNSCKSFTCGWLLGNFDERFRPDKIGAYVAFFMPEDSSFYAVVQCVTAKLNRKRLRQLLRRLSAYVPDIRLFYDNKHGVLLRHGKPAQRFIVPEQAPGDFQTRILME
jgi:hypothetical protein